jgi:CDP-glycerol glycerophosphotransferase (TagB/SpsB family)
VAHQHKIPVVEVQHAAITDNPVFQPISADKITATGPHSKRQLVALGEVADKIVITGDPKHDGLGKLRSSPPDPKLFEELGIDRSSKVILLTTQPTGFEIPEESNQRLIKGLMNSLPKLPNCQLVIKLHPSEDGKLTRRLNAEYGKLAIITKNTNLHELILASDVLVTVHSTTGLEAMLLGKPVLVINLTGKPDMMPYVESGAALGVYDENDILGTLEEILYNPKTRDKLADKRKEFVADYCFSLDGLASQRVVKLIYSMIQV